MRSLLQNRKAEIRRTFPAFDPKVRNHPESDTLVPQEAAPFPEGARIGGRFREWFERERKYREEMRTKRRGRNLSYAICGNERGTGMTFAMEGTRPSMRHVRRECVMNCQVYAEWHSVKDPCYVIYEDGQFSSAAAQRAVLQK